MGDIDPVIVFRGVQRGDDRPPVAAMSAAVDRIREAREDARGYLAVRWGRAVLACLIAAQERRDDLRKLTGWPKRPGSKARPVKLAAQRDLDIVAQEVLDLIELSRRLRAIRVLPVHYALVEAEDGPAEDPPPPRF